MLCSICPRRCGAERSRGEGFCESTDTPRVARAALHLWEEPPISGTNGSGAVFFCGCNLRCLFCQNKTISAAQHGVYRDAARLEEIYFMLESQGAHNINLVTPSTHAETLLHSMESARSHGLKLPFIWNTNAYESVTVLKQLEGLVDIYLPDFKYVSPKLSKEFSGAVDYFERASAAVLEMQRQVGPLEVDDGIAKRGVLVRHLVLPACGDDTRAAIGWIAGNMPAQTHISVMRQYTPMYGAVGHPVLGRRLTKREYDRAVQFAMDVGLINIYIQRADAASEEYTPEFDGTGVSK